MTLSDYWAGGHDATVEATVFLYEDPSPSYPRPSVTERKKEEDRVCMHGIDVGIEAISNDTLKGYMQGAL